MFNIILGRARIPPAAMQGIGGWLTIDRNVCLKALEFREG